MYPVFAICDLETEYAVRFMEYLGSRKLPFEVRMFTDIRKLCGFAKETRIELLLISERAMCDEIGDLGIGKIVMLREDAARPETGMSSVFKYQSGARIVREVLDCYTAERRLSARPGLLPAGGEITAVYGIIGTGPQLLFSLTYGQIMAEQKKTLLLDLQRHPVPDITGAADGGGLSDLLFMYRGGQRDLSCHLPGMTSQAGSLDIIPGVSSPEDIGEMSGSEWTGFLEAVRASSRYDAVIANAGDAVRSLPDVMRSCARRILLSGRDAISASICEEIIRGWQKDGPAETVRLTPPDAPDPRAGRWYVEGLPGSALGSFIREKIARGEI